MNIPRGTDSAPAPGHIWGYDPDDTDLDLDATGLLDAGRDGADL